MKITIIGAGNVGTSLAVLLKKAGNEIVGIASRTEKSASRAAGRVDSLYGTDPVIFSAVSEVVFLTTPDDEIRQVCEQIASRKGFMPGSIVVHTSGAHSSSLLESALACGAYPMSLHPLQTFANPDAGILNLPGSFITMEGHPEALSVGRLLISVLGCKLLEIPTAGKVLYHAAACIACNYLTVLLNAALEVLEKAGINREQGIHALQPLIEGTLGNISRSGTVNALTGPISRGDVSTVKAHIAGMEKEVAELIPLYKVLGRIAIDMAAEKGTLDPSERLDLIKIFGGEIK